MIDSNKAKEAFKEYVKFYDKANAKVENKIVHTIRVANSSKKIAMNLKLEQEDILLAELIGLLHDIGRFEQIRRYNTLIDKDSINHGIYGAKILFEDNVIRNFIEDGQYDTIIKTAIVNHNTGEIKKGLSPREELHSKIIRDADKTDIFYALTTLDIQTAYCCDSMEQDVISKEIIREFKQEHKIDYAKINNGAERMVANLAYVYDFNYNFCLQIIQQKGYIDRLVNKYEFHYPQTKANLLEIANLAKQYIEQRLK